VVLLAACGGEAVRDHKTPAQLLTEAQTHLASHDFDLALKSADRLREEYPFSPEALEGELLAADVEYTRGSGEFAVAAESYRAFADNHPTHPKADYAMYRRGVCHFEMMLSEDRDQTSTQNALSAFEKLIGAYPKSTYVADARVRIGTCRERLAAHELYVARYYLRKDKPRAAQARLAALLQQYPDAPQRDAALKLSLEIQAKTGAAATKP
jgi:outer membrane protein assembly factor BamD